MPAHSNGITSCNGLAFQICSIDFSSGSCARCYARETVADDSGGRFRQRVRWWSALALLRALASSPAAAAATLRNRAASADAKTPEEVDKIGRREVLQPVCSSGASLNRRFEANFCVESPLLTVGTPTSFSWRSAGICASRFPTATSRSCSPSGACAPITSRCGDGFSVTPRKSIGAYAQGSYRPTTVGGWTLTVRPGQRQMGVLVPGRGLRWSNDRLPSFGQARCSGGRALSDQSAGRSTR
jgi:hypothetical protein